MAEAKELDIFQGTMTYNVVSLYSNGTKKRFSGFIVISDTNGNDTSYKINSFRSQVCIQSEALGERGMAGKKVTAHGYFKENTWNGKTSWELMCEKLYIDGMEQLAADAEASGTPMPAVPPGQLPGTMHQPIQPVQPAYVQPTGPAPIATPVVPAPLPVYGVPVPTIVNAPVAPAGGPTPIPGAYIHVETAPVVPMAPVAAAPVYAAPYIAPVAAPITPVATAPVYATPPVPVQATVTPVPVKATKTTVKAEEPPFEVDEMPLLPEIN